MPARQAPRSEAPIGVFDSGVGGLSVLRALRAELPLEDFVYFSDAGHAPYGEKDDTLVTQRAQAIAGLLLRESGIKALVVACNTATAVAAHQLRARFPELPVIGVEPALKPAAAASLTQRVAVLATRGTLASAKFAALLRSMPRQTTFVLQACDGLAAAIEADDTAVIAALCRRYTVDAHRFGTQPGEIDTLVLGCTHYPFAEPVFRSLVGPAIGILDTGAPVARQTRRVLQQAGMLRDSGHGRVQWRTSGDPAVLQAAAARWLGL